MRKLLRAGFIIAVCFLVSMSVVYGVEDNSSLEEKWRLPIGSKNVRYETKYTIILNGEKHEYYLKYKEVIPENKNIKEAKFKGYYWGMKNSNQDLERDENYIYSKDKVNFTREDVIEFLEIKDEKLVATIKEGCEFFLYVEPCYNYKKGKWSNTYKSTLRELYKVLPEAKGDVAPYQNAKNESYEIQKEKIQGVEFLRELIVKSMKNLKAQNLEIYSEFKNEYKGLIKDEMLGNGFYAYHFEKEGIKTGEFIKMITLTLWPNYKAEVPKEGEHALKPYADALDRIVLMSEEYDFERLEKKITRKEAARLLCLFYMKYNSNYVLNNTYEHIQNFKDEALVTEEIERICIDDVVRFGLMKEYEDGTFRPNDYLTKKEATKVFEIAKSKK